MKKILLTLLIIFIAGIKNFALAAEIPPVHTQNIYVADYAAMLDAPTKEKISAIGKALDEKYKAQVSVVTIQTLGDSSIEDFANKLFNEWKLGDRKLNNGVLFLISKDDKKFRIEVGYGLEGAITDGYAGEILDGMTNYFREEKYSEGTLSAYSILTKKIYEEYGGEVPENISENIPEEESLLDSFLGLVAAVVFCAVGYFFMRYVLVFPLAVVAFIFSVILYKLSNGNHGTLNFKKIYFTMSDIFSFSKYSGGGGSSGGGSSSSGGGHGGSSGGGGASGGW